MKKHILISIEDTLHDKGKKLAEAKFGKPKTFSKWIESKIKEDDNRGL